MRFNYYTSRFGNSAQFTAAPPQYFLPELQGTGHSGRISGSSSCSRLIPMPRMKPRTQSLLP